FVPQSRCLAPFLVLWYQSSLSSLLDLTSEVAGILNTGPRHGAPFLGQQFVGAEVLVTTSCLDKPRLQADIAIALLAQCGGAASVSIHHPTLQAVQAERVEGVIE